MCRVLVTRFGALPVGSQWQTLLVVHAVAVVVVTVGGLYAVVLLQR